MLRVVGLGHTCLLPSLVPSFSGRRPSPPTVLLADIGAGEMAEEQLLEESSWYGRWTPLRGSPDGLSVVHCPTLMRGLCPGEGRRPEPKAGPRSRNCLTLPSSQAESRAGSCGGEGTAGSGAWKLPFPLPPQGEFQKPGPVVGQSSVTRPPFQTGVKEVLSGFGFFMFAYIFLE